jgi:hypothetical protein
MPASSKATIYVEADDEITTVIDKVLSEKNKIVAVVLPKRATVFQSVVNMKLLKKATDGAEKRAVLISSDPAIETIAAAAKMYTAQSLNTKPEIPRLAKDDTVATIITSELEEVSPEPQPIVEDTDELLESDTGTIQKMVEKTEEEPIELDNTTVEAVSTAPTDDKTGLKKKKNKNIIKIPDFSSFRLRATLLALLVVVLVGGWYVGFVVMPKATVTINTDTSTQAASFDFILRTGAQKSDLEKNILPAKKAEVVKENKVTAQATGEKDAGEKATGLVTLTNCVKGSEGATIQAGTGFSSGSKTYVTTESLELGPAVHVGNSCKTADFPGFGGVKDVPVVASNSGESYNIAEGSMQSSVSGVSAYGSAMTGGTTKKVKVVSADDIQKAKDQLKGAASADAITELTAKLADLKVQSVKETLEEGQPVVKVSAAVDSEVSEFTVTQTVTYRMLGVDSSDLGSLLDDQIKKALAAANSSKNVRSNGLDKASYQRAKKTSFDDQTIKLSAIAVIGPVFDEAAIRNEVVGVKRGDIENMLESRDGVKSVSVEYSPMWITTTPKDAEKITVIIKESEN